MTSLIAVVMVPRLNPLRLVALHIPVFDWELHSLEGGTEFSGSLPEHSGDLKRIWTMAGLPVRPAANRGDAEKPA